VATPSSVGSTLENPVLGIGFVVASVEERVLDSAVPCLKTNEDACERSTALDSADGGEMRKGTERKGSANNSPKLMPVENDIKKVGFIVSVDTLQGAGFGMTIELDVLPHESTLHVDCGVLTFP